MRSLPEVIDRIVARVPRLKDALDGIRGSSMYAPPEAQVMWWREMCNDLASRTDITPEEDAHIRAVLDRDEP